MALVLSGTHPALISNRDCRFTNGISCPEANNGHHILWQPEKKWKLKKKRKQRHSLNAGRTRTHNFGKLRERKWENCPPFEMASDVGCSVCLSGGSGLDGGAERQINKHKEESFEIQGAKNSTLQWQKPTRNEWNERRGKKARFRFLWGGGL